MKTLTILFVIILFCGCSKKSLPHFQNTKQPAFVSKNSVLAHKMDLIDNVEQIDAQNQSIASVSPNELFIKKDLVKENLVLNIQEKTNHPTKLQKNESVKLTQILKIKQSNFEEKPKYEGLGNAAGIFGFMAIGLILLGIVLAFFTPYAFMLITISFIAANIALLLGAFSIKKVEKKWKAKLGLAVGIIMDILLISFIILVANY